MNCECNTKVLIIIDGDYIAEKKPLEENDCEAFRDCLDCVENDKKLKR